MGSLQPQPRLEITEEQERQERVYERDGRSAQGNAGHVGGSTLLQTASGLARQNYSPELFMFASRTSHADAT